MEGKVTMSADLNLTYRPVTNSNPDTVLDLSGEYCFGQDWGCENATAIDGEGFAMPFKMLTAGHLLELLGNISDSTFDGTTDFGPLPTGEAWGAANDFYLVPGGCGIFETNLNSQGFPNPAPLSIRAELASSRCAAPVERTAGRSDCVRRNGQGNAAGEGGEYFLGTGDGERRRLHRCDL